MPAFNKVSTCGKRDTNIDAHFDDTGLDTADRDSADTADLVDVLERETERLVGRASWRLDGVDGLEQGLALLDAGLGLLGPALVPGHVGRLLEHVVAGPSGDGDESDVLGVVADLLDEVGRLLDDFIESVLGPLYVVCAKSHTLEKHFERHAYM